MEFGLSALLDRVWKIEDREAVIRTLHKNAVEGNEKAASLLLAYAYGRPTEKIQHNVVIEQATKEYQKLKADFPDLDDVQLKRWFAELKGLQPEQITEMIQ